MRAGAFLCDTSSRADLTRPLVTRREHNGVMGIFAQRPEEPTEWAGLPGEPRRARSRAEMLPEDEVSSLSSPDLLGVGESPLSSISIPLDAAVPVAPTASNASAGDEGGGDESA